MTTPTHVDPSRAMTPDRWRAVDAIIQIALACEPHDRDGVIADACEGDDELRREVMSLMAEHVNGTDAFLEQPPVASAVVRSGENVTAEQLGVALDGRYAIEREIARGGMATVYLARDLRHGRRVAIKVLRQEIAAAIGAERFLSEIRVTASLQHPHILPLFDSGNANGLLWYAMPYVDGETLRAHLMRAGSLPAAEAVRLAREIADALEYAHGRGIVHRDVKPENVLLQDGHAVVADFGIALALEQAGGERITRTGLALGTPQYMAPEQAAGDRAIDGRVDVYALGAVLHEMIAGEPPFAAPTRQAVVRRMMHELPATLTVDRADVTPYLDSTIRRALAKRPDERYPSALAFARALAAASAAPIDGRLPAPREATTDALPSTKGRSVSARSTLYAAAAMLVVGLLGGVMIDRSLLQRAPAIRVPSFPTPNIRFGPPASPQDGSLTVYDRAGRTLNMIGAHRPWTPRFSPDGKRVAYGAYERGRESSNLWTTDLATGATQRLTDDGGDANDPQWSADGASIAYSVSDPGGKDVVVRSVAGGAVRTFHRGGTQFPSDWRRDGSALLVTDDGHANKHDILIQPTDGSPARPFAATRADETAARVSADGRWVAYTSDASGRPEVYLDSYANPGHPVMISAGGGLHPVWRADGRELFYWHDGALIAVAMAQSVDGALPVSGAQTELFRASYQAGLNTMYDVSPDGQRFVIVH